MSEKLKDKTYAAEYLTKAFRQGDPINLQCALQDVIKAQGGYHKAAAASQMSEYRLKLMLWDDEECYKIIRLVKLLKGMGLEVVVTNEGKK